MKNLCILFVLFSGTLLFQGCGKDYLDEPKPTDVTSATVVFSSREGVEAYLSGIYRMFRDQYEYSPGVTTTDIGGLYSVFFARTVKGKDIIQANTWYTYDYTHTNREPTYRRVRVTWQYLYDLLNQTNVLIKRVKESSSLAAPEKKEFIAHGKALRAFIYLQIAMEYSPAYAANPDYAAPPLYTEPVVDPRGMSTLREEYALMLSDINGAIDSLPDTRINKSYINKSVAYGIKAQILMAMNQGWDQVETAANAAYGGNVNAALDAASYSDGFNSIDDKEWLWGMDQSTDQSNYYYCAPHAFTDHLADAYFASYVDKDFVSLFTPTDVRALFIDTMYHAINYRHYVTKKFRFSFDADIPIMRTSEMILAEAEAKYHQGKEGEAHDLLYKLQKNRDDNAVMSTSTGTNLLEEILVERRKELYGENGIEWFDARRLQRGIVRGTGHRTILTLQPNDNRFFLKIPQSEIDANPLIDESVNADR